jgi:hypothetical protein
MLLATSDRRHGRNGPTKKKLGWRVSFASFQKSAPNPRRRSHVSCIPAGLDAKIGPSIGLLSWICFRSILCRRRGPPTTGGANRSSVGLFRTIASSWPTPPRSFLSPQKRPIGLDRRPSCLVEWNHLVTIVSIRPKKQQHEIPAGKCLVGSGRSEYVLSPVAAATWSGVSQIGTSAVPILDDERRQRPQCCTDQSSLSTYVWFQAPLLARIVISGLVWDRSIALQNNHLFCGGGSPPASTCLRASSTKTLLLVPLW